MNHFVYNYNMEEETSAFTNNGNNNTPTNVTDAIKTGEGNNFTKSHEGLPSTNTPSFSGAAGSNLTGIPLQQEAMASDTASSNLDLEEFLYNIRMSNSDAHMDNEQNTNYYYGNGSQAESLMSSQIWSDNASNGYKSNEMSDTFDFLIKSLSSANNYVSMLTREQLAVLRSIRPSLLYEFLQEVARVRSDRRMRRALPHECAFCKNNGENEECYSSHALKDFRGRVLCPVLRAFRCPKCDATGDRAHTIKYCPENIETVSDRSAGMGSRRRSTPPSTLILGAANRTRYGSTTPNTPASSPSSSYSQSYWAALTLNSSM